MKPENIEAPEGYRPWQEALDQREHTHLRFCLEYADHFAHGAPGHLDLMLIAKLARLLDRPLPIPQHVCKVSWSIDPKTGVGIWRDLITGVRVEVP